MHMPTRDETGETLVEVIIALMILGVVVGAFFATVATTASAAKAHRDLVTADAVLRDYAEAAKQGARDFCLPSNTGTSFPVSYTPPAGSGITVTATGTTCPAPTTVNRVDITAQLGNGTTKMLSINVRTP